MLSFSYVQSAAADTRSKRSHYNLVYKSTLPLLHVRAQNSAGSTALMRTEPPAPLQVDGEAVACSIPGLFSVNIEKGALRVLLPPADVQ